MLVAPDGYRIIDFEGEPLAPDRGAPRPRLAAARRGVDAPLARPRRAERPATGRDAARRPAGPPGLDIEAWIRRARERFLEAYRAELAERRVWVDVDPDLLHAFEVEKELYEFVYAATYLPTWLWAPPEGMRALFEDAEAGA